MVPAQPLAPGASTGSTARATVHAVTLGPDETLHFGALSTAADLALVVETPDGGRVEAHSARADHRAASLRLERPGAGEYRVLVRARVPEERGDYMLIRREPMDGTICDQLARLAGGDPWALPGADHPREDASRRTRSLVAVMPWADECTVSRIADLDVGPSCTRHGLDADQGAALHATVERDFRSCHAGWELIDESDGATRELAAERDGKIHFLRLREAEGGWQLSTGALE